MENVIKPSEAKEALDLADSSRAGLGDRLVTPWWYHPVLGVLIGALVAAPGARSVVVSAAVLVLFCLGVGVLVRVYRRMTGVWVSGFNAGPASRWAIAAGAVAGLAYVISLVAVTSFGWWPASVALAVLVVPAIVVLGRRFDTALRAQLRAGG